MGDNFDLCECVNILNHEQGMQRLLSMLRSSQTVCNDNECFTQVTGPSSSAVLTPGDDGTQISLLTVMIGWIVIAMILYFLRPNSWRARNNKKNSNGNGRNGDGDNRYVL